MKELEDIQSQMVYDNLQAEHLGAFSLQYLEQILMNLQVLSTKSTIGKVSIKYISALKRYIECFYIADFSSRTIQEIAIEQGCSIQDSVLKEYLRGLVIIPFRRLACDTSNVNIREAAISLSAVIHAINGKTLHEMVGECDEKTFNFILDAFGLVKIDYRFESFRDPHLEVLYSNDGISLGSHPIRTSVNKFFRFFIDGDALKGEEYNSAKYYGCTPISESRILSYCKNQGIPEEHAKKLMSIVKCSNRFEQTESQNETLYSLKIQYLNNKYAMSVAILFKEGKPLHKKVLYSRIQKLHNQYPNLVEEPSLSSFVLRGSSRAKPILCSASAQGEWKLQELNSQRDILQDIRDFVTETYGRSSRPVSLEEIRTRMSLLGHSYPERTLQTYITKSGCVGQRRKLYLPPGFNGDKRIWTGKQHEILREVALCLLNSDRFASRKSIMEFIAKSTGYNITIMTLNRALASRPDLFSITGSNKRNQLIVLSNLITGKRDVNRVIPEPEKKEQDYVKNIREKIIDYLFEHSSELQKNLTDIFIKNVPKHLKSGDTMIRKILSDKEYFFKQQSAEGTMISLLPAFRKRRELEKPFIEEKPESKLQTITFSWEKFKDGLMVQLLKDNVDQTLPKALNNVFRIFCCGEKEIPPNSNFKRIVFPLFRYVTSHTSVEERRDLQEKILGIMEAFMREFYRLKFGDSLQDRQGFGALRYYFQEKEIFPDKERRYLTKEELTLYRCIESVNTQRNKVVGHPAALAEQSDERSIKDIHDCLSVMVYLGKQL